MIFKSDPAAIQGFLEDTSNLKIGRTPGVFFPETFEEVAGLLRSAGPDRKRYTIAGNGTGTTGGRIPVGDYVIAMHRLNSIGSIVPVSENLASLRVQGGTLLEAIQAKVESEGWFYPPDPTEKLCFIGSTIANNSSGARSLKYGPTRNHIRSITVALPQGDIIEIARGQYPVGESDTFSLELPFAGRISFRRPAYSIPETSKHNAGYFSKPGMDLIDLFIGSEGTLGIILEAELQLIRIPPKVIACLVYFIDIDSLFSFVGEAKKGAGGVRPRAIELFDEHSLSFLRESYPDVPAGKKGAIYFEQETGDDEEVRDLEAWLNLMESCGAVSESSWVALDRDEQEKLRNFRHDLPALVNEWLSRQQESKISTDMAVPDNRFRELFDLYRNTCEREGFTYIIFGHIGNAHVHLNILPRNRDEFLRAKDLYRTFVSETLAMGGTLSAEHGIGKLKTEYLQEMYGEEGIREMARVKKVFDPYLVLNIGNIIPAGYYETAN
jgi:D-lactate dehydrogenase (cytochrome)